LLCEELFSNSSNLRITKIFIQGRPIQLWPLVIHKLSAII
jgi:hypothetical protein